MGKTIKVAPKLATITVGQAEMTVRTNPPASALADLMSGEIDRILRAIDRVVMAHPFVDDDGLPLRVTDLDMDTLTELTKLYGEALAAPKP